MKRPNDKEEILSILQDAVDKAYKEVVAKEQTKTQQRKQERKMIEASYQRYYGKGLKHLKTRHEKGKYKCYAIFIGDPITKVYCETRII